MTTKEKTDTKKPPNPKRTNARSLKDKKFHRLIVKEETTFRSSNGAIIWRCECKCGTKSVLVATHNLTSRNTRSCGCYQKDASGNKPSEKLGPDERIAFVAAKICRDRKSTKQLGHWSQGGDRVCPRKGWVKTLKEAGWPVRLEEVLVPQAEHRGHRKGQETTPVFQAVTIVPGIWLRALATQLGCEWEFACRWELPDGA